MKYKKRIYYLDVLRALAIISVILLHIFGGTLGLIRGSYSIFPPKDWFIGAFMSNISIIGVPLFLMLTGALSLGRHWDIKPFLEKRIKRIILPFLFWIILLSILVYSISLITQIELEVGILELIAQGIIGGKYFYQIWFIWMILGIYLIMPIFNKWILYSDLKEVEYFLIIWLITCLFDFTLSLPIFIELSYFTSPIGLVVLGYYLRHTERKIFKNTYMAIFLIIISSIAMIVISYLLSTPNKVYTQNKYSIFVVIEVIGIYLLFRNTNNHLIKNPKGFSKKIVESLSKYSYGLYLVHISIFFLIGNFISHTIMNYELYVLTLFTTTLLFSLSLLYISTKIPHIKKINGIK